MRRFLLPLIASICMSFVSSRLCRADVVLPPLFSEHAVLERTEKAPVFGRASPQERVVVTLGGVRAEAVAGADGQCAHHARPSQDRQRPI